MSKIYTSVEKLIGHTPLLELRQTGGRARVLAKLECFNPGGSVKDRVAVSMLDQAAAEGRLHPDTVLIEPTSGNTGIGLAAVCAARGLPLIIVMPETMSVERRRLIAAYGAKIVLTEGAKGMRGAIEKAEELKSSLPNAIVLGQFTNTANPQAHFRTTGREIFADTDGNVDVFVAGVGTGGTLTGVGEFLKSKNPEIRIVAVEPSGSPVLSGGCAGPHGLQGIGAGFLPKILKTELIDEIVPVTEAAATATARELARHEGILVGISSGAAAWAAFELAKRPENDGKTIVTLLPDTGERYLSTSLFAEEEARAFD